MGTFLFNDFVKDVPEIAYRAGDAVHLGDHDGMTRFSRRRTLSNSGRARLLPDSLSLNIRSHPAAFNVSDLTRRTLPL